MDKEPVIPVDEKTLSAYLERAYKAESFFFPDDATLTGSSELYDAVVSVGNAVRALVAHVRGLQTKN